MARPQVVSLQYLRGIAALGVVALHTSEAAGLGFDWGREGVDVFFVISGFVMWLVTDQQTRPIAFFLNRIVRVVPLYWFATLLVGFKNHAAGIDLLRSLLFIPFARPDGDLYPVLIPGWTLNLEMFFYVLFAIGLFLPMRARLAFLSVSLGTLVAIGLASKPGSAPLRLYTDSIVLEFLAGAWLGAVWKSGKMLGPKASAAILLAGLCLIAVRLPGLPPLRFVVWGLPAIAMVAGVLGIENAGRLPHLPPLKALGDSSYSLYLFHGVVLSVLLKLMPQSLLILPLGLALSVAVGLATYRFIERPVTRTLHRIVEGPKFWKAKRSVTSVPVAEGGP